jgi:predicted nucleic acid-binding protein
VILTDTSVLIRHYRNPNPRRVNIIRTVDPVVCGMTVAEVLAGARTPPQTAGTIALLAMFGRLPMSDSVWEASGRHHAFLAANGLTVPLADTIIATVAKETGLELWTYDLHFAAMAGMLPVLKLFHEPP